MATENQIERTIGLVLLAILAIGCVLVLRPFFTAVCFALILVVATWPTFERLRQSLGGRRTLAALLMVALATLVFVVPPALVASSMDQHVAGTIRLVRDLSQHGLPPPRPGLPRLMLSGRRSTPAGRRWRRVGQRQRSASRGSSPGRATS